MSGISAIVLVCYQSSNCLAPVKMASVNVDEDDSDPRFYQYIGKIWGGLETEKSQIIWDFPDM